VRPGASVAVAGDAGELPVAVGALAHEGASRVAEARVAPASVEAGTEHVVGDAVQRQEKGASATLLGWNQWELHFLKSVS